MTRFVRRIGLPLLLLCYQAGASMQNRPPERDASGYGRRIAARGVPELIEITPTLYRGGQPTPAGLESLAAMGIAIVVDGRGFHQRESEEVNRLGMQYVAIPWHCPFPRDKVFAEFLSLIRRNPGKKIFVHCLLGDDRVGMMIAAWRMADEHWTAEQAMQEMQANGFTWIHHFICPSLAGYEKKFPERYKTDPIFRSPVRAGGPPKP